jgi:pilus assembly protein CpaC
MKPRRLVRHFALSLAALALCASAQSAFAQDQATQASFASAQNEAIPVNVLVGQSRVITFDRPLERFSISNPEVAEAVLVSSSQAVVNGKGFGQVNFIAWEKGGTGRFIIFDVYVRTNLSLIDSQIRALFPKDDIRLSQANGSVVLSGSVSDTLIAQQADAVVQAAGFKTVNMLSTPVKDQVQVQLQVRVAEVSRSKMRELASTYAYQSSPGVGGSIGTGGGPYTVNKVDAGSIFGTVAGSALNLFVMGGNSYNFIHALKTQGALRSLAEPNLIAMNGQQASFLAGGEFPVPIAQSGSDRTTVTIQWKEYGVRLNFKPTIIDEDHIRLEMEPEVSTLDFANGIRLEGFVIPALKARRAKTGVELRDGQSFALAGLLDNSETQTLSKIPGIGDIPILGNLFKSKSFQKNETELMFIVTAHMVKPVNRDDLPQMPNVENLKSGSPLGIGEKADEVDGKSGFSVGASAPSGSEAQAPAEVKPVTPAGAPAAPAGAAKKALAPNISATKDGVPAAAVPSEQTAKASPNQ